MRRLPHLFALLLLAVTWLVGGQAQARSPDADAIARMLQDIGRIVQAEEIPGVGIALVTGDGVVLAAGVGQADREHDKGIGPDTCFRVGSISKTFIALTVLRLVERGVLDLDVPIHEYAPELVARNPWLRESPVTLAHVLEHTAGFDDMHFNEAGSADTPELSVAEALSINPRSRTSRWRPGSRMAYANPGTTVAAHVIEEVTGESFEAVVHREVLGPLEIAPAGFRRTPRLDDCLAQGYGADGVTPVPYWTTPHRPAGHLTLSPRQLGKLVQMFVRRGDGLVAAASIDRMERSGTREHSIDGLAYGLANYGDFSLPSRARGHDGGLPGFVSEYRYFPELGVGWVLLYNTTSNNLAIAHHAIRRRVFQTLTEGMELARPSPYVPSREELERWVGTYEHVSPRHEIFAFIERLLMAARIELRDDGLVIELGLGVEIPLVPVGPGQLTVPGFSGPMLELHEGGQMLLGDASYVRRSAVLVDGRAFAVRWGSRIVIVAPVLVLLLLLGRRRRAARRVLIPAAAAAVSLWLVAVALVMAAQAGVLGKFHPWTLLLFVATLLAPASAGVAMARSIRGLWTRAPFLARVVALVISVACFALVMWLRSGHFIGLRTWAW
jgi:CubicO group peptidase (beta-lactamase class C family)